MMETEVFPQPGAVEAYSRLNLAEKKKKYNYFNVYMVK